MIGLDTNVLLRYLIQDDEAQGGKASRAIRQAASRSEPIFIGLIVLCEMFWVLESAYGYRKATLVELLEQLLDTSRFEIEQRDAVRAALADYRSRNCDFSDCVIGRTNHAADCRETITFDRSLKPLGTFRVL